MIYFLHAMHTKLQQDPKNILTVQNIMEKRCKQHKTVPKKHYHWMMVKWSKMGWLVEKGRNTPHNDQCSYHTFSDTHLGGHAGQHLQAISLQALAGLGRSGSGPA